MKVSKKKCSSKATGGGNVREECRLVAGAHGVSGRAAAQHWTTVPSTQVYGLSRRSAAMTPSVIPIVVDLLGPIALWKKVAEVTNVTHVVFGAYIERASAAEKTEINVAILENLLDVIEETSPALRHVTIYQGGKAYGADLGPFKTPAREDDHRTTHDPASKGLFVQSFQE
jgi:NAD dependent epimerase/dehydratase family